MISDKPSPRTIPDEDWIGIVYWLCGEEAAKEEMIARGYTKYTEIRQIQNSSEDQS